LVLFNLILKRRALRLGGAGHAEVLSPIFGLGLFFGEEAINAVQQVAGREKLARKVIAGFFEAIEIGVFKNFQNAVPKVERMASGEGSGTRRAAE